MSYNYDKTALVEVHAGEAFAANLILCGAATDSGRISVFKALADDMTMCRGPFFVSAAAASSGADNLGVAAIVYGIELLVK